MAKYTDQSAKLAALEKEIERLEDMGGHDHRVRELRAEYQQRDKIHQIWLKKQKFPRLFAQMHAAAADQTESAQALVTALLTGEAKQQKLQTRGK